MFKWKKRAENALEVANMRLETLEAISSELNRLIGILETSGDYEERLSNEEIESIKQLQWLFTKETLRTSTYLTLLSD